MLRSGDTNHAAPRASRGLSGYGGREFLAALRELWKEPQGRESKPHRIKALDLRSPAVGPELERSGPRTLTLEAEGRGWAGRVGREGSQVWSWGGAKSRRKQNVEFSRRQTRQPRCESAARC